MEPGKTVPQISFLTLKDIIWAEVRYEAYFEKPELRAYVRAKIKFGLKLLEFQVYPQTPSKILEAYCKICS